MKLLSKVRMGSKGEWEESALRLERASTRVLGGNTKGKRQSRRRVRG